MKKIFHMGCRSSANAKMLQVTVAFLDLEKWVAQDCAVSDYEVHRKGNRLFNIDAVLGSDPLANKPICFVIHNATHAMVHTKKDLSFQFGQHKTIWDHMEIYPFICKAGAWLTTIDPTVAGKKSW
jgi:hypothetical protein